MKNTSHLLPVSFIILWFQVVSLLAQVTVETTGRILFLDFDAPEPPVQLYHGARRITGKFGSALEFTTSLQYAEVEISRRLHEVKAVTVGGWFFPRRTGEQSFFFRGVPEIGPLGDRFFRPAENWVNFLIGTDQRGFFMGTINGNGSMPFPRVTVNEAPFDAWSQLVVTKSEAHHKFYLNGVLVHTDEAAVTAGKIRPFIDTAPGEPVRLAMPLGGIIGEAWVLARELSSNEIQMDFKTKKDKYHPALPGQPVLLREMNQHPQPSLWKEPVTRDNWPHTRQRIRAGVDQILGRSPISSVPLDARIISEEDKGSYLLRKISLQVEPDDRMPAYLLIPKNFSGRLPAVICFYGTSSGAGKLTTVGLSGLAPGSPPQRNYAFAIDMAEAGFVAFAADYLRDGERIEPGQRPYDTTRFYARHPDWSIHGKDAWDTSRAIDYLETLDFVDPDRIGMTGHSYGGHSTLFTAAIEPRIKVAVANGPVSDFLHHGMHWAVPKGAGNSQSMPALRPYVLDHTLPLPVTFYEFTALIAPRPLLVGQAAGERRPMEEENYAAVSQVYQALAVSIR